MSCVDFATVIEQAAVLRAERAIRAERMEAARRQELIDSAAEADRLGLMGPAERTRNINWTPELLALIEQRRAQGVYFKTIAAELSDLLGVECTTNAVCSAHLKRYG